MTANRTGLFGGTFDPVHIGHLIIAQTILRDADLDRIIFIPSGQPPHKETPAVSSARHRLAMVKLAVNGNPKFDVSSCEIESDTPSYTVKTIDYFQSARPDTEFCWLIGADSLSQLHTWYHFDELISKIDIVTANRAGFDSEQALRDLSAHVSAEAIWRLQKNLIDTPRIEIAANEIRSMVEQRCDIRYLVPENVRQYIHAHGLYR